MWLMQRDMQFLVHSLQCPSSFVITPTQLIRRAVYTVQVSRTNVTKHACQNTAYLSVTLLQCSHWLPILGKCAEQKHNQHN